MAFKDTYRLEKVYYENMWTLLKSLKALKENPSADEITKVNEILDDTIACNESIIIIYKNLGELYAEVAEKFADLLADLKAIRDDLEMWKNEINEKIDEVNNYLMGLIRDLDDRVTSLEGRVSDLEDRMDTAEDDIDALEGRMDTAEGDIDALEGRMDTAEGDIDALEGRMDTAEDDIDDLQGDVSDLEQNKQDKLTPGFGIEIDSNNEISVDTTDVQEKLIAGQNITLTPDSTDPTKTVIDATGGGSSYTAGPGIVIDSNNIINACWWDSEETVIDKNTDTSAIQNSVTGQRAFWVYRSGVYDLFPASVDSSKVIGVLFRFSIPASAFTQNLKNAIKNLPNKAIKLDFKNWWVDIMYDDNGTTIHQYYYLEGWNAQTYVYTVSGLDYIDNPFGTIEKFVRVDNQHNYKIEIGGNVQCSIIYDDGTDHTTALQAVYNSRFGFNIKATLKGKTGMK